MTDGDATTSPPHPTSPRGPWLLLSLYAAVVTVIIASQRIPYRAAFDQKLYHLPVIREFTKTWPSFETWDYLSATTPGFHIVMATVAKALGESVIVLQVVAALITALLLWLIARDAPRRAPALLCAAVSLPIIASPYTLFPAAFILPDNMGWLGVTAMLLIALRPMTARRLAAGGLVLCLLVLTRQVHAWTAGLLWVSAWLSVESPAEQPWLRGIFAHPAQRAARTLAALAATIPAILVLAAFVRYWGGLVPGRFSEQYPPLTLARITGSPAAPMLLSMLGAYSLFYAGFLAAPLRDLWRNHRAAAAAAIALGVLLSIIPATTADFDAGRRGILWSLGARGPILAGRTSLIVVLMSAWGALCAAAWLTACSRRDRTILLAALLGFTISQLPSPETWHRYFDPFVLIMLALLAPRAWQSAAAHHTALTRAAQRAGPALLAAGLLAYSVSMFFETGLHAAQNIADPAPPSKDPGALHHGIDPPVDKPPTPKPAGKSFWAW